MRLAITSIILIEITIAVLWFYRPEFPTAHQQALPLRTVPSRLVTPVVTPVADVPREPSPLLIPSTYELAEVVFRRFLPARSKDAYFLCDGERTRGVPADFLARFTKANIIIRSGSADLALKSATDHLKVDRSTGRETIVLHLTELTVTGAKAKARLVCAKSFEAETWSLRLEHQRNAWRIRSRKSEQGVAF